jgi:hypothetical protein
MKSEQIKKLLRGVYRNFLNTIDDTKVKQVIKEKSFISGGCIPSMLMDEFVNDYDFYFVDIKSVNIIKEYFSNKDNFSNKEKYIPVSVTENAITLSNKIQLITKFYGTPYAVTNKFDWEHIKSYFQNDELYLNDNIYKYVVEKELESLYESSTKLPYTYNIDELNNFMIDILKEYHK